MDDIDENEEEWENVSEEDEDLNQVKKKKSKKCFVSNTIEKETTISQIKFSNV